MSQDTINTGDSFWYIDSNLTTKHSVVKAGYAPSCKQKELILAGNCFKDRQEALRLAWVFKVVLSKGREKIVSDNEVVYGTKGRACKANKKRID